MKSTFTLSIYVINTADNIVLVFSIYSDFCRRPTTKKERVNTKEHEVAKTRKNPLNQSIQGTLVWLRGWNPLSL